jgi:hypothetical protein
MARFRQLAEALAGLYIVALAMLMALRLSTCMLQGA